jgi:hypothetical protein
MVPQIDLFDPKGITLGQCILMIFEKAINIHFLDHMNKLTYKEISTYFFIEPSFNIF